MEKKSANETTKKTNKTLKIIEYLDKGYDFRRNEIKKNIEYKSKDELVYNRLDEVAYHSLMLELDLKGLATNKQKMDQILGANYLCKPFNPFTSYFETLPKWDGEYDFIKELCETVDTSIPDLWCKWFKKWLVAFVACSIKNFANASIIVFVGGQNVGKTRWVNALVPKQLKEYYYSGSIDPTNKDTAITLSDCVLINLDELGNLNRGEIRDLKNAITEETINIRLHYGTTKTKLNRHASFIASVNEKHFLTDTTGNRRFIPIPVNSANPEHKVNIDMVFAQAYSHFIDGFQYWYDRNETKELEDHNIQFTQMSLEEELLLRFFIPADKKSATERKMASEILEFFKVTCGIQFNNAALNVLGKALNKHGFQTIGGKRRKWLLKSAPTDPDSLTNTFDNLSENNEDIYEILSTKSEKNNTNIGRIE